MPPAASAKSAQGNRKPKGVVPNKFNTKEIIVEQALADVSPRKASTAPLLAANSEMKSGRCQRDAV
jgi:hypothetical protein